MANINTWTVEKIVALLNAKDEAVERALVAIYNRQTEDEKRADHTRWDNKIGFSAADAKRGAYYARWVIGGRKLTGHHLVRARRMAIKYRAQLLAIALDSKPAAVAVKPAVKPVSVKRAPKPVILRAPNGREICNHCNVMKCPDGCCCAC